MCGVLALLFIAIPALEIYVLITVGGMLGALPTLAIIIATGIAGAALAKHQGLAALRQLQSSMAGGDEMGRSLAEAALVLVAAVLMVTPGFLTDFVGIALLIPPIRAVAAVRLVKWGASRVTRSGFVVGGVHTFGGGFGPDEDDEDDLDPPPPGVIDV